MRLQELEHVVAAAAHAIDEDEFVVVGSQAILGTYPDAPDSLLQSIEAHLCPLRDPSKAEAVDGAIGEGSHFHRSFGYYAHGVGPGTAKAPAGWQGRLVRLPIPERSKSPRRPVALCLEPHDLVLAKCVAGRDRDWDYAREAIRAGIVDVEVLESRVGLLPVDVHQRDLIGMRLQAIAARLRS